LFQDEALQSLIHIALEENKDQFGGRCAFSDFTPDPPHAHPCSLPGSTTPGDSRQRSSPGNTKQLAAGSRLVDAASAVLRRNVLREILK
jgi:hypothetical protein